MSSKFTKDLPALPWVEADGETLTVRVAVRHHQSSDARLLVQELLCRWLVPGRRTPLSRFQTVNEGAVTHLEASVDVERQSDLPAARVNLDRLKDEIALALGSADYAQHLLGTQALSVDQKNSQVHRRLVAVANRFPRLFDASLFADDARALLASPGSHRSLRDASHISRIVLAIHRFKKALVADVQTDPDRRHIRFHLLPGNLRFPFGTKQVLGLIIGTHFFSRHEIFGEKHALSACRQILPGVQLVQSSDLRVNDSREALKLLYLEIEKEDGTPITLEERKRLSRHLAEELDASVERLTHSLFVRRNEEESLRTALILSRELRESRDIPQVNISFLEQSAETLTFNVIMLRLESGGIEGTQLDWHRTMGTLESGAVKHASCFTVEVEKVPYLRKDFSVDLYKARGAVVALLEDACGEVRDYNGGLIAKQEEVLSAAKRKLPASLAPYEQLFDKLFYAFLPAAVQGSLPAPLVSRLFERFGESLQSKKGSSQSIEVEGRFGLIIRLEDPALEREIQKEVEALELDPLMLATASLTAQGSSYLVYLYLRQDPEVGSRLLDRVHTAIQRSTQLRRQQRTLRLNITRYISSLDPRVGGDRRSGVLIKMLYEGLTRIGKDGTADLALAQQVAISADLCTYTFTLRSSSWSNGKPVTAMDFEYAWKKVLDPSFKQRWTYMFAPIENADRVKRGEVPADHLGVHALDDHTLVVRLEHPTPYFLDLCAHWTYSPLCRDMDEENPGWSYLPGETFVCNGPFRLAQLRRGDQIQLVKNPHYWDAQSVHLRAINVSMVTDPQVAYEMFRSGQLDLIGEPLCKLPRSMAPSEDHDYFSMPAPGLFWFILDTQRAPFRSAKVRQAMACALDRGKLLRDAGLQEHRPASGFLPEQISLGNEWPWKEGDLERARALFNEGLAEQGLSAEDVGPITLICPTGTDEEPVSRLACEQWSNAFGIRFGVEPIAYEGYVDTIEREGMQVGTFIWYSWLNDPIYNLTHFEAKGRALNFHGWEDPRFAQLLQQSDEEIDPDRRDSFLREAEAMLFDAMPVVPIYQERYGYAVKPDLRGLGISDLGQIDFKQAYFSSGDARGEERATKVFQAPLPAPLPSLDPRHSGDRMSRVVMGLLYEGLVRHDREGKAVPALAERIDVSDDGRRYTFHLRETLWSDGTPVRAQQFVRSWQEAVDPNFGAAHAYGFSPIRHADEIVQGRCEVEKLGVSAPNDRELRVELEHPAPYFIDLLATPIFYPVHETPMVSNGPFRCDQWHSDGRLSLALNQKFAGERGNIQGIELPVISDPHTAYSLYQRGELDWLGEPFTNIPREAIAKLGSGGELCSTPVWGLFLFAFNCERFPFHSTHLRRAFALALDREWLATSIAGAQVAQDFLPPPHALTDGVLPHNSDVARAQEEFAAALEELGMTKEELGPISVTLPLLGGFPELSRAVQRRWQEVFDIPIALQYNEWSRHIQQAFHADYQIGAHRWYAWHSDPAYNLGNLEFWTKWEDPTYRNLLLQADGEVDHRQRRDLLRTAQERVDAGAPIIPIHFIDFKYIKSRLQGEWITPQGGIELLHANL
jgi:oligopeptide transport system substrate-binding protein